MMYRICGRGDDAVVCLLMEALETVMARRSGGRERNLGRVVTRGSQGRGRL